MPTPVSTLSIGLPFRNLHEKVDGLKTLFLGGLIDRRLDVAALDELHRLIEEIETDDLDHARLLVALDPRARGRRRAAFERKDAGHARVGKHGVLDLGIDLLRIAAGVQRLHHLDAGEGFQRLAHALLTVQRPLGGGVDRRDHHLAFAVEHLAHELAGFASGLDEVLARRRRGVCCSDCRCCR